MLSAIKARPIILVPLVFLIVEAGMNAVFGFRRAGGGLVNPSAWLQAAMFAGAAVLASFLPTRWRELRGDLGRQLIYGFAIGACFAFSQVAGWSVTGTMLADNQAKRDTQALQGELVTGGVKDAAAELKTLAAVPHPDEVRARIEKEMSVYIRKAEQTVGAATRDCADPGWAPQACRRVADLRIELKKAERKAQLVKEIDAAGGKLAKAPQVAAGAVDVQVPVGLVKRFGFADGAKDDEIADGVRFWFIVFFVGFTGFFATFGFALVGVSHAERAEHAPPPRPAFDPALLPAPGRTTELQPYVVPVHRFEDNQVRGAAHQHQPHAHATGAPINISFALPAGTPGSAGPAPAVGVPPRQPAPAPAPIEMVPLVPVDVADAPAAPDLPVDRSAQREMADHLLAFHAACVTPSVGAVVSGRQMYERYARWAGARAVSEAAFDQLYPVHAVVSAVQFGGEVHYRGVTLRGERALAAV